MLKFDLQHVTEDVTMNCGVHDRLTTWSQAIRLKCLNIIWYRPHQSKERRRGIFASFQRVLYNITSLEHRKTLSALTVDISSCTLGFLHSKKRHRLMTTHHKREDKAKFWNREFFHLFFCKFSKVK